MTRARILSAAYLGSIVLGIALVALVPPVTVWPGYQAPAAVYVVGLTLVLRDLVQREHGPWVTLLLMAGGIALSLLISPAFALASAAAFAVSETVDLAVFSALHRRTLVGAVLASGSVALLVDSWLFLSLAFGDLTYLPGQIIGKALATLAGVAVLAMLRRYQPSAVPA